jgi:hypothetical protein
MGYLDVDGRFGGEDWIELAEDGVKLTGFCGSGNEFSCFKIRDRELS